MRTELRWAAALLSLMALVAAAGCIVIPVGPPEIAPPQGITEPAASVPTGSAPADTEDTASAAPAAAVPPEDRDTNTVDVDPASGRSGEVDFEWEQLCVASEYQLQIASDPDFSIIVVDTGPFAPADITAPAAYYPAGGIASDSPAPRSWLDRGTSAIASPATLQAGHTYYARVRVRQAATGQHMLSPWSQVYKFTVKSGLPTASPGYSPQQPLSPDNGYADSPPTAPAPVEVPGTPPWAWALIGIGTILIIATLVLIFNARQT